MGFLLEEFVSANPDFFKLDDPILEIKEEVFRQSARHLIRDFKSSLIADRRPLETELYRAYREKNRRRITADGIIDFEQMAIKSLKQTSFNYSELPKILQEDLESMPYKFMNTYVDIDTWIYKVLIPYSSLDCNAITIEIPVNKENPYVPLTNPINEGGLDPLMPLEIKTKIIPYHSWNIIKTDMADFLIITIPNEFKIKDKDDITRMVDYYYLADETDWYIYLPIEIKDDEIIYELMKWYPHDYESLPFAFLPGINFLTKDLYYYQESFCKIYLEWADEFLVRFQDDQIVHTRYAYPREVVEGIDCNECAGSGWKVMSGYRRENQRTECKKCNGTGKIVSESISGRIFRSKDMLGSDKKEPIAFVNPDVGILAHTTPNAFFFLEEARKSLGLNALNPNIQEAEGTKEIREQNKVDKLLNYAYAIIQWKQKHLNQKLALLDVSGKENEIKLQMPLSISVKSEQAIKQEIDNSLPIDKFYTTKKYIQEKYFNDPEKQRIHILAIIYAPFLMLNEAEIQLRINRGAYDELDLIRADKAVYAFEQLVDEPGFMEKDDEMIKKAEEIISKYFLTNIGS